MADVDIIKQISDEKFNQLSDIEKWSLYKTMKGVWRCVKCSHISNPRRVFLPFRWCRRRCDECGAELTKRTRGGQSDPFNWRLFYRSDN